MVNMGVYICSSAQLFVSFFAKERIQGSASDIGWALSPTSRFCSSWVPKTTHSPSGWSITRSTLRSATRPRTTRTLIRSSCNASRNLDTPTGNLGAEHPSKKVIQSRIRSQSVAKRGSPAGARALLPTLPWPPPRPCRRPSPWTRCSGRRPLRGHRKRQPTQRVAPLLLRGIANNHQAGTTQSSRGSGNFMRWLPKDDETSQLCCRDTLCRGILSSRNFS